MSDPYATILVTEFGKTTQVIEETLSPTWDELLVFEEILIYSAKDEIVKDPPTIVIEIYDQDKVGKSEFIGRAIAKPKIKLKDNQYKTPTLEWFEVIRGTDNAGELLAAFELLELGTNDLPHLTEPKYIAPVEFKSNEKCIIILYRETSLPQADNRYAMCQLIVPYGMPIAFFGQRLVSMEF